MIQMIDEYLTAINATAVMRKRVALFQERYSQLIPGIPLSDVFASEIRDSDGLRLWRSLWLWRDDYLCEAPNFLSDDRFDGVRISAIRQWTFSLSNFEIDSEPTERSRAALDFTFGGGGGILSGGCHLTATAENCVHLVRFFREVIVPRI